MIVLRAVTRRFGTTKVLDGIDLTIAEGSFVALLGPSGCGKSTLLRLIAGLDRPTTGQILIGGRDVGEDGPAERNIAMVFQSYALYPHLTVAQNIALPLAMRRLGRLGRSPLGFLSSEVRATRRAIAQAALEVARALELEALVDRKPAALSGGQKQRVALARALVRDPVAFLLDEPLSNLDARLRVQMRAEITALHRRTGRTFVHVTHDQAEAMGMADRVAIMLDGRIAQEGTPRTLYERPASRAVAAFVGSHPINLVPGPAGGGLPGAFADLSAPGGGPLVVGLRPEHLRPEHAGRRSGTLVARLVRTEYQGQEILLDVVIADGTPLRAVADAGAALPDAGGEIRLGFDPRDLHLFDAADGARRSAPWEAAARAAIAACA